MPLTIGAVVTHPGYLGGNRWYNTHLGQRTATAIGAIDTIYFYPFFLPTTVAFAAIGIRSTSGGAGSSCKAGIWANNPTIMRPSGAPSIVDNTGIATTGTGELPFAANVATLGPGWYWAGSKFTGTLPTIVTIGTADLMLGWAMGFAAQASLTTGVIIISDTYSNSMPTLATNQAYTESSQNAALLAFKVA